MHSYELFYMMLNKNNMTYAAMLTSFVRRGILLQTKEVYERMSPSLRDLISLNALINRYLRISEIKKVNGIFKGMAFKDDFTQSSMVNGYYKNGMVMKVRQAF